MREIWAARSDSLGGPFHSTVRLMPAAMRFLLGGFEALVHGFPVSVFHAFGDEGEVDGFAFERRKVGRGGINRGAGGRGGGRGRGGRGRGRGGGAGRIGLAAGAEKEGRGGEERGEYAERGGGFHGAGRGWGKGRGAAEQRMRTERARDVKPGARRVDARSQKTGTA